VELHKTTLWSASACVSGKESTSVKICPQTSEKSLLLPQQPLAIRATEKLVHGGLAFHGGRAKGQRVAALTQMFLYHMDAYKQMVISSIFPSVRGILI